MGVARTRNAGAPADKVRGLNPSKLGTSWAFDVAALALCLAVWLTASDKMHDLTWPCENDLYRDLGAAQSILDGNGGIDPSYLGERRWYNPLVPALVAFASRAQHTPLHEAYTRFGTELNLLAPLAFYAMVRVLFNRGVALSSLLSFLFLGPLHWPSWLHATYSPWLWPCNFAQGLFYLAILAWVWAARSRNLALAPLVGAAIGLTLLAHAAPAFLLVGVLGVAFVTEFLPSGATFGRRTALLTFFALIGLTAVVVGWPFLREWLSRPRSVQNPTPLTWVAGELTFESWRKPVARLIGLRGGLALVGIATLIATWRTGSRACRHTARALLGWGIIASLGLGYGYAAQRITLPPFMPSWHFFFYLQALQSVLFGVGVAALAGVVEGRFKVLGAVLKEGPSERQLQYLALAAALLSIFVFTQYSRYAERVDLVDNRKASLGYAADPATKTYAWLVRYTVPSDVVLAEGNALFYGVQPAGRKLVALPDLFSNPFVALKPRADDSARLFADLEAGEESDFRALASKYEVHYVVLAAGKPVTHGHKRLLRRVFKSDDRENGWDIYTIRDES
jgi:hypothetical protein